MMVGWNNEVFGGTNCVIGGSRGRELGVLLDNGGWLWGCDGIGYGIG